MHEHVDNIIVKDSTAKIPLQKISVFPNISVTIFYFGICSKQCSFVSLLMILLQKLEFNV